MIVYMCYLKETGSLYGFTLDRRLKNYFRSQRNKDLFQFREMSMGKKFYYSFEKENYQKKMCTIHLTDGEDQYHLAGTNQEDNDLSLVCEKIYDKFLSIKIALVDKLNTEYLEFITTLTNIVKTDLRSGDKTLEINTFKLFYYLFKFTFFQEDYKSLDENLKSLNLI